jgi:hypothetical protein
MSASAKSRMARKQCADTFETSKPASIIYSAIVLKLDKTYFSHFNLTGVNAAHLPDKQMKVMVNSIFHHNLEGDLYNFVYRLMVGVLDFGSYSRVTSIYRGASTHPLKPDLMFISDMNNVCLIIELKRRYIHQAEVQMEDYVKGVKSNNCVIYTLAMNCDFQYRLEQCELVNGSLHEMTMRCQGNFRMKLQRLQLLLELYTIGRLFANNGNESPLTASWNVYEHYYGDIM